MDSELIYSRNFLLKIRELELCQQKSRILKPIDLTIIVEKRPPPYIHRRRRSGSDRRWDVALPTIKRVEKLVKGENAWTPDKKPPTDIKKIKAILNKLSSANKEKMLEETQEIEYTDPEVVSLIFKKAVTEPFFSELYAQFCMGLTKLHQLIRRLCAEEFGKHRNKNLCKFVGELYKLKLIDDLQSFVNVLKEDLDEKNIEILCELIKTINPQDPQFEQIINDLYKQRTEYSSRYKFMIMDVHDYKSGKREFKPQKAKVDEIDLEALDIDLEGIDEIAEDD